MQHQFQASIISQAGSSHPDMQPVQTSAIRTEVPDGEQTQPLDEESQTQMSISQAGAGSSSQGDGEKVSPKPVSGRRSGRSATMTNEEWTRQRKDNHVRHLLFYSAWGGV